MHKDESQLIARAARGDEAAFREIVEQYKQPVYYLALDLTGNHYDAEDLSQEVFIRVHRALGQFRGEARLSSYLYRITTNLFINTKRKKALTAMSLKDNFDAERSESDPFNAREFKQNPEASAEAVMIRRHVRAALAKLSAKERAVFVLRHYQDLPLKEIAATLSVAEGTVKSLLFRALRRLQKELAFYRPDMGVMEKS